MCDNWSYVAVIVCIWNVCLVCLIRFSFVAASYWVWDWEDFFLFIFLEKNFFKPHISALTESNGEIDNKWNISIIQYKHMNEEYVSLMTIDSMNVLKFKFFSFWCEIRNLKKRRIPFNTIAQQTPTTQQQNRTGRMGSSAGKKYGRPQATIL